MKPKIDPRIDAKIDAKNDDFLDPLSKPVLVREREARYMLKRFVCFHFHGFWQFLGWNIIMKRLAGTCRCAVLQVAVSSYVRLFAVAFFTLRVLSSLRLEPLQNM